MSAEQTRPIELHYWSTPNGFKISIMLEELGIPYDVHFVNISRDEQFKPEFLRISPNNRIPAIIDPEGPGGEPISVFESGAILQYLGRKFGRFYPLHDERRRVEVEEWLMWQMGGFGPMLGQNHHFRMKDEVIAYGIERYQKETDRLYGVLDRRLEGRDCVAGEYSIADMAILGWAHRHERHHVDLDDFPNVRRWYLDLVARPAVRKGLSVKADSVADLGHPKLFAEAVA